MIRRITLGISLALAAVAAQAGGLININSASAERLAAELDGIGEVRAQAIVDYREANGPFQSVAALTAVDGIGDATLADIRDRLTVGTSK